MDSVPKPGGIPTGKERYIKGAALGEGTFGVVTKAEDTVTHKIVAIKKIRLGKYKEGVNFTAIREIKLLQELRHPHVIELVDCFPHKRNLNLVFECCESDLEAVIKDKFLPLGTPEIKSYMQMTLRAVAYCHESWVLHRDLKPNNLPIAPNGALKLADFGLARVFGSPNRKFTHQVFARWYRAPELLLGSKAYGPGVDVWAVGCVFAELMLRKPFFPGSSDIDQLGRIYQGLGTPTEETWPGHKTLPDYMEFSKTPAPDLRGVFATAPPEALDLLKKLMAFDPNRRVSAAEALRHAYFSAQPLATPFPDLPRPTQKFGDDVRALVAWSVVPFRRPSHPLFMAGANYDRLVAKLANAVVEKEQTKWREVNTPIPRGALEERLGRYCASQVKAMHAEHYDKA